MHHALSRTYVIALTACCFVISILLCLPTHASAQERVTSYETTVSIQPDSSVDITERIVYDFGSALKRGIYRDIDTVKKMNGKSYRLELSNVEVVNDTGEPYEVEILDRRKDVRLNIGGDVPRWTGATVFEISYTVDGLLVFNENNDALLLDVIGFDWGVQILNSQAQILLPTDVMVDEMQYECYAGQPGSTNPCDSLELSTQSGTPASASDPVR